MTTTAETERAVEILLTIPPKAEYLAFCRLVLAGISQSREIDAEVLADLKLAVTEACSNAIRHAYVGGGEGEVEIRYELAPEQIVVEVADTGSGFELPPEEAERETLSEDGMGIAIVGALMDELELTPGPHGRGSRFRFSKYLG